MERCKSLQESVTAFTSKIAIAKNSKETGAQIGAPQGGKMKLSKSLLSVLLCLAIAPVPSWAAMQKTQGVISTMQVVNIVEREQLQGEVYDLIDRNNLEQELAKSGLNKSEIGKRMATLSHAELLALQTDIQQAKAGGILVEILLVVLIIYLIQRI